MNEPPPNRAPEKLAEQLVTYADAITAFSFVQSVAFGFALGQKDFRDSVLKGPWIVMVILIGAYVLYWHFVRKCRQGVAELLPGPKEANPPQKDPTPKWNREAWKYRTIVLALGLILSLLGLTLTMIGACLEKKAAPKPELRLQTNASPQSFQPPPRPWKSRHSMAAFGSQMNNRASAPGTFSHHGNDSGPPAP